MIVFNDEAHGRAILEAGYPDAGQSFNPAADKVISRVVGGALAGGVVYQEYTFASIAMHIAIFSPRFVNRDMLWLCFHYPFVQLNCRKVLAKIPTRNAKSLQFCAKLGFVEVAFVPDVYLDCGLTVLSLARADCKWLSIDCGARRIMEAAKVAA